MVIEGKTNRDPDDTSITVEAVRGPSHERVGTVKVDEWGQDGRWRVALGTDETLEPGRYTVQIDDGVRIDEKEVAISACPLPTRKSQIESRRGVIKRLGWEVENLRDETNKLNQIRKELIKENQKLRERINETTEGNSSTDGVETREEDGSEGLHGFTILVALLSLVLSIFFLR